LYVETRATNKFKRYLYPQCNNAFIEVRNIWFARTLRMGGGAIVGEEKQLHVKKIITFNLSNFIQNSISPQRPLSTQHPIYHTVHCLEHIIVTSCS